MQIDGEGIENFLMNMVLKNSNTKKRQIEKIPLSMPLYLRTG
jgi:hypothetical protein